MSAISLTLGTKTTKQLLEVDMNVPEDKIVALREGTKYWFTNGEEKNKKIRERFHLAKNVHITVTPDAGIDRQHINVVVVQVIDVYHCPGSCMFVFFVYPFENDRVGSPFVYAYTGDYFYKPGMETKLSKVLGDQRNGKLVYDNTRTMSVDICFSFQGAQNRVCRYIKHNQSEDVAPYKQVFLFLSNVIGMEDLWLSIARKLGVSVFVDQKRYQRLQCYLKDEDLQRIETREYKKAL